MKAERSSRRAPTSVPSSVEPIVVQLLGLVVASPSGKSIEQSKSLDSQYAADAEAAKTTRARNAALREFMVKKPQATSKQIGVKLTYWTRTSCALSKKPEVVPSRFWRNWGRSYWMIPFPIANFARQFLRDFQVTTSASLSMGVALCGLVM